MNNLAGAPEMMPPILETQSESPSLMERMRSDEGYMRSRIAFLTTLGSVGLAALAAIGSHVDLEKNVNINAGKGTLKETFILPAEECHGGYINNVEGARAELNVKVRAFGITVPTTYRMSETFNGDITSIVCNTSDAKGTRIVDKENHKITINIPASAFHTRVYRTNPELPAFVSDNGAAAAIMQNTENIIKVVPKLDSRLSDDLSGRLQGLATLAANETSSKACGEKAWKHLRKPYASEIQQAELADAQAYSDDGYEWKLKDVTVNLPEEVSLETQYGERLKTIVKQVRKHGVSISAPDAKDLKCDDTTDGLVRNLATGVPYGS